MKSSVAIYQAQTGVKKNAYGMVSPACCLNVKHLKRIDEKLLQKFDIKKIKLNKFYIFLYSFTIFFQIEHKFLRKIKKLNIF
jgi:hypothetical protein